jgi:hypothetical protein
MKNKVVHNPKKGSVTLGWENMFTGEVPHDSFLDFD